jgi:hypothetical protein
MSDDEDDNEDARQKLKESGNIDKLLMHIPPDFKLAEINGVSKLVLISCSKQHLYLIQRKFKQTKRILTL